MIIADHSAPAVFLLIARLFMLMKVFLSRSHLAPDMPLGFVGVQNFSCLAGKGQIDLEEPLGNIWSCQGRNKKFRI